MATVSIIDFESETMLELSAMARKAGFSVETMPDLERARKSLLRNLPDVAILNIPTGSDEAVDQSFEIFARTDLAEVVDLFLVSTDPDFRSALRGIQIGASDYFEWPDDKERLNGALQHVNAEIKAAIDQSKAHSSGRGLLRGESAAMKRVYRVIRKVAPTEATVFLAGESGSGKELIANTIHQLSNRSDGPMVAMNCGAIASELIESEMFGHRKGAFTGAHSSHKGYFERAFAGTLFLDEVTEMDPELQVKLLRVLETRVLRPVGGEKEVPVDVRIIASTNRDPQQAVKDGTLREDLYYRLAEFPLRVPPLRERGDDVVLLAESFLTDINKREAASKRFSSETLEMLRLHDWPGNVRELKNAVSRGFILATEEIQPEDLPGNLQSPSSVTGDYLRFPVGYNLKEVERRMILATVEHFEDDKPRAAEALGVSLKTLYNRLKAYNPDH